MAHKTLSYAQVAAGNEIDQQKNDTTAGAQGTTVSEEYMEKLVAYQTALDLQEYENQNPSGNLDAALAASNEKTPTSIAAQFHNDLSGCLGAAAVWIIITFIIMVVKYGTDEFQTTHVHLLSFLAPPIIFLYLFVPTKYAYKLCVFKGEQGEDDIVDGGVELVFGTLCMGIALFFSAYFARAKFIEMILEGNDFWTSVQETWMLWVLLIPIAIPAVIYIVVVVLSCVLLLVSKIVDSAKRRVND